MIVVVGEGIARFISTRANDNRGEAREIGSRNCSRIQSGDSDAELLEHRRDVVSYALYVSYAQAGGKLHIDRVEPEARRPVHALRLDVLVFDRDISPPEFLPF